MSTFSIYLVYKEQAGTQASRPLFINFHCSSVAQDGGGDRIRTDDPLLAKQMLYQLSYAPVLGVCPGRVPHPIKGRGG
jgi:hypothetical protein